MKFIEVDHTPDGKRMNSDTYDGNNTWIRRVRLDQFAEFRLVDNRFTGSDYAYFILGVLPNEPRYDYDNIIASFDRDEYDKAQAYLDKLISELNGD